MDPGNTHTTEESQQFDPSSIIVACKEATESCTQNDSSNSEYQGFWYCPILLKNIKSIQQHFQGQPGDVLLCSSPKAGTTWLKSLAFTIMTRTQYLDHKNHDNPLLTKLPHECVPFIEVNGKSDECIIAGKHRLLATHISYTSLPASLTSCKIVYICREPKDLLVSKWQFISQFKGPIPLEAMFEAFCEGKGLYEPYWDHVLGYWKASLDNPHNILFLRYEELMSDSSCYVKKMAEFLGCPFSLEEQESGEVEKIVNLCSFKKLSTIEVNKSGESLHHKGFFIPNKIFFRKGQVGDWKNHLTSEMKERIDRITRDKFEGYNLIFPDAL